MAPRGPCNAAAAGLPVAVIAPTVPNHRFATTLDEAKANFAETWRLVHWGSSLSWLSEFGRAGGLPGFLTQKGALDVFEEMPVADRIEAASAHI